MYRCDTCGNVTPPCMPMIKRVVETRVKVYTNYNAEGEVVESKGHEIVKEVSLCEACSKVDPELTFMVRH